jgi:hypothetical protein
MFKPSRLSCYLCAFIAVLCSVHTDSRAESWRTNSAAASSEPILRSWMDAIGEATQRGGHWLVGGRVLQLGVSSQSTPALPPMFSLNGLGASESVTAVASFPLTNRFSIGASAGFHHPLSASSGAAQGFGNLGSSGRVFGVGLLAHLSAHAEASLRIERLTSYAGSPLGTLDATVVALGVGIRF